MKLIAIQLARLLAAVSTVYALLLLACLAVVPLGTGGARLDSAHASDSLFITEPKYVFLARPQLDTTSDKLILLGASNVLVGLRQEQLQPRLPQLEVHSLAVSGSNITEVEQVVDLVAEVQGATARRHTIYAIGLWYGLFADDLARWSTPDRNAGDTDIDIERYRYGFYRRTPNGPAPVLPARYLGAGTVLIHPYLVLDRAARDLTKSLRDSISGKATPLTDEQRNSVVVSKAEQDKFLAFWRNYMGSTDELPQSQFRTLQRVVDKILASGGRVVLVDLPIPAWHSQRSALWRSYASQIEPTLAALQTRPGVAVLRLGDDNRDDDFADEVHPRPRVAPLWAARLAKTLNSEGEVRQANLLGYSASGPHAE